MKAYDLCRELAKDCAELLIWEPSAKFALSGALKAHRHLALGKQEDWANLALAYLRASSLAAVEGDADIEIEEVLKALGDMDAEYTGMPISSPCMESEDR